MAVFNVIQYTYPDGTHRWKYFTYGLHIGDTLDPKPNDDTPKHEPGWTVTRKEYENASRAKQTVYDLARSNADKWDWFVTLTFSPRFVCRWNYQDCYTHVRRLAQELTARGCYWLFVPELHRDGKSFHFHGLVGGDIPRVYAGLYGPPGRERDTWNLECFPGYSTIQRVVSPARVCTYITKYITKDLVHVVPKGCHRYLRSRNLSKPVIERLSLQPIEFAALIDWGEYHPEIQTAEDFARFLTAYGQDNFVKQIPIRYTLGNESMFIVENHKEELTCCSSIS